MATNSVFFSIGASRSAVWKAHFVLSQNALGWDYRQKREVGLDEVSEFALFRAIVETGGISAAALALQSSPAAVSRRLSAMETKLGVRLAERSSRRFRLTDEGLLLYERCRSILDQIRDAEAEVASRGGAARGLLRIGAPADFGRKHIAPLLPAFTAQHPGLDAHLILSDIGLENESDGCDLVFRFGLPSDPTMIARKIATTRQIVCAAPSYVARRGTPASPDELRGHDCLRLARRVRAGQTRPAPHSAVRRLYAANDEAVHHG
jgi:DNA-binding transcriptional LysR family regulator